MSTSDLCDRICHFFYKVLPEAELRKCFSKEKLSLVVKESVNLSKLGELTEIREISTLQDHEVSQSTRFLILALLDNIRFGSKESDVLKNLLFKHLGYHDLEYESCIEQRRQIREEFLKYSELMKKTPKFDQLKSYMKLVHFARLHNISRKKFDCELHYFAEGDGQRKLLEMLSLPQSKDLAYIEAASQLVLQLHPDWNLMKTTSVQTLSDAMEIWPEFRSRATQVICMRCCDVETEEEMNEVSEFILSLVHTASQGNNLSVAKSLLSALDAANISQFTKSILLSKISTRL